MARSEATEAVSDRQASPCPCRRSRSIPIDPVRSRSIPFDLARSRLMLSGSLNDWLDVDDGRAVNGFKVLHVDPAIAFYFKDKDSMQTDGIRAIGGTSCEHALDRVPHIIARVNLENRSHR